MRLILLAITYSLHNPKAHPHQARVGIASSDGTLCGDLNLQDRDRRRYCQRNDYLTAGTAADAGLAGAAGAALSLATGAVLFAGLTTFFFSTALTGAEAAAAGAVATTGVAGTALGASAAKAVADAAIAMMARMFFI